MLSKSKIKFIRSLETKKGRTEAGLFLMEGEKIADEIIHSQHKINLIAATGEWFKKYSEKTLKNCKEKLILTQDELNKISFLKSPQPVLCLAEIPGYVLDLETLNNKLTLVLDNVQDPGNLGTIIRIADWYGIGNIICSRDSADAFSPKVVQATMGAILRIKIFYEDLNRIILSARNLNIPVYGATLDGENIYSSILSSAGMIVMGNESKGISDQLQTLINKKIFIPFYPEGEKRSESLNVAVATAVICAEFRRREMGVLEPGAKNQE